MTRHLNLAIAAAADPARSEALTLEIFRAVAGRPPAKEDQVRGDDGSMMYSFQAPQASGCLLQLPARFASIDAQLARMRGVDGLAALPGGGEGLPAGELDAPARAACLLAAANRVPRVILVGAPDARGAERARAWGVPSGSLRWAEGASPAERARATWERVSDLRPGESPADPEGETAFASEGCFHLPGRQILVGYVASGRIRAGDTLHVFQAGQVKKAQVAKVEMYRRVLEEAKAGDLVGLEVTGATLGREPSFATRAPVMLLQRLALDLFLAPGRAEALQPGTRLGLHYLGLGFEAVVRALAEAPGTAGAGWKRVAVEGAQALPFDPGHGLQVSLAGELIGFGRTASG